MPDKKYINHMQVELHQDWISVNSETLVKLETLRVICKNISQCNQSTSYSESVRFFQENWAKIFSVSES